MTPRFRRERHIDESTVNHPADIDVICDILRNVDGDATSRVSSKTLAVANEHGLLPLVAQRLTEDAADLLSDELLGLVRWVNRTSAAAEMLLTSTTRSLLEHLAKAEIPCLLLKGTALAHRYYPEPRLRPRTDVDLWIEPDRGRDVARLLERQGYAISNLDRRQLTSRQFQASTEPVRGYPVTFDIHLAISNRAVFRDALDFHRCRKTAQPLNSLGGEAPEASALLLHACLHRIAQGRNTQVDRLIWLYDIHLLFSALAPEDRNRFLRFALDRGLGGTCADGLRRSADAFGTRVGDTLFRRLESRAPSEPATQLLKAGKWTWLWSDVRGEAGWIRRARFLGEVLQNRAPLKRQAG
jgi:hypothetical protein